MNTIDPQPDDKATWVHDSVEEAIGALDRGGGGPTESQPTIIELMESDEWFAPWFRGGSWEAWKAFLCGVFGLPMTAGRLVLWQQCTQRQAAPTAPADEAWMVVGRRGGKSFIAAFIAVYLACFREYLPYLAPGEWATVPVISADAKESRTVMRYVKAFLEHPRLVPRVVKPLAESVELRGRVQIEVHVARFKAVRSYTVAAAVCDEIAFWETREESASPDSEVLNALRPATGTIPGSMLIGLSSPYARAGVLWEEYTDHFGKDHAEVVWQADTATMHPHEATSKLGRLIATAYEKDPDAAGAEYGALFRTDIEKFISEEAVREAIIADLKELLPVADVQYVGFVDPSGGTEDSMTLGIAHTEGTHAVLDLLREVRPPFSPRAVVGEFAIELKRYDISTVVGDRYGGEWPRERFREEEIFYEVSELVKSEIYLEFLASMNSHQVQLLDNARMKAQLMALERRRGRSGRDIVDHPPRAHDDVVNAAAGAVRLAHRPLGWQNLDLAAGAPLEPKERTTNPLMAQIVERVPEAFEREPDTDTCAACPQFLKREDGRGGKCKIRNCSTDATEKACELFGWTEGE
jgi:hypothetical protein